MFMPLVYAVIPSKCNKKVSRSLNLWPHLGDESLESSSRVNMFKEENDLNNHTQWGAKVSAPPPPFSNIITSLILQQYRIY